MCVCVCVRVCSCSPKSPGVLLILMRSDQERSLFRAFPLLSMGAAHKQSLHGRAVCFNTSLQHDTQNENCLSLPVSTLFTSQPVSVQWSCAVKTVFQRHRSLFFPNSSELSFENQKEIQLSIHMKQLNARTTPHLCQLRLIPTVGPDTPWRTLRGIQIIFILDRQCKEWFLTLFIWYSWLVSQIVHNAEVHKQKSGLQGIQLAKLLVQWLKKNKYFSFLPAEWIWLKTSSL